MTIKDITQAAAGTFMSRSCASSKFTLINGSQIKSFQKENMILQIDMTHTYTTDITDSSWPWKKKLYEVYMVEYVPLETEQTDENTENEDTENKDRKGRRSTMTTWKVKRTIETETNQFAIGDKIELTLLNNEHHTATAIRREADGMLFVFDDILKDEYPMNKNFGEKKEYEDSDMRKYLREHVMLLIPSHIVNHMVKFENGDHLRLLTREEVFGAENGSGQISYFKDKKNRAALREGFFDWWWLQDAEDDAAASFADVTTYGDASYDIANTDGGVRPAFKIGDL